MPWTSHKSIVINVIEYVLTQFDPTVSVFCCQCMSEDLDNHTSSEWRESYGSKAEAEAFVRGCKAAFSAFGTFDAAVGWKKIELVPVAVKNAEDDDR